MPIQILYIKRRESCRMSLTGNGKLSHLFWTSKGGSKRRLEKIASERAMPHQDSYKKNLEL